MVIVVGGVALELLASNTTKDLAGDHGTVAVVLVVAPSLSTQITGGVPTAGS